MTEISEAARRLKELREQAVAQGKSVNRIDKVVEHVTQKRQAFAELAL